MISGIRESGQLHTWHAIANDAVRLARSFSELRGQLVAVEGESEAELACRVLAALHAGAIPVLGNNIASVAERIGLKSLPKVKATISDYEMRESLKIDEDAEVAFCTSGSAGPGKVIRKTMSQLLREVEFWQRHFSIDADSSIISLVSMRHIYGHLFGFLLAYRSQATLHVVRPFSAELQMDRDVTGRTSNNLIVSVPSTWSLARLLFTEADSFHFVTSGAAFGNERSVQLSKWVSENQDRLLSAIEVLGSTETGGYGMRHLLSDERGFRLIPNSSLQLDGDAPILNSPFLSAPVPLDDKIVSVGEGVYKWMGRRDRVIKFGAKRFSLDEFEQNIREVVGQNGTNVRCFYLADEAAAHGGELVAFVGPTSWTESELRVALSQNPHLPVPQKLFVLENWPDGQTGKIGFDNLITFSRRSVGTFLNNEVPHV